MQKLLWLVLGLFNAQALAAAETGSLPTVVYVTGSATFDGPVGGYTTVGRASSSASSSTESSSTSPSSSASSSMFISSLSSVSLSTTPSAVSTSSPTSQSSSVSSTAQAATTPASQALSSSQSMSSKGITSGAKAGIAIGAVICIISIALGCFFLGKWVAARSSKAKVGQAEGVEKVASQNTSSEGLEDGRSSLRDRAELEGRDRAAELDAGMRHELEGRRRIHEIG